MTATNDPYLQKVCDDLFRAVQNIRCEPVVAAGPVPTKPTLRVIEGGKK